MPDVIHVARIIPLSPSNRLDDWKAATAVGGDADGLNATSPLYTASDPTPRTATHRAGSGVVNASQLSLLDTAGYDGSGYLIATNIDPSFSDIRAKKRNLSQGDPNPFPGMLSDAGLTQDQN